MFVTVFLYDSTQIHVNIFQMRCISYIQGGDTVALYIKQNDGYFKFYTDESARFMMVAPDMRESVILSDMSKEFDGICTDDGSMHFLIQSDKGELLYLKHENGTWKKYNIFKNKDNVCKISNIKLTCSGNVMCAFYVIEHRERSMIAKHTFSASNLYVTPEIADLTDRKKDFCICTNFNGNMHLFYRDIAGRRQEIVYDKNFVRREQNRKALKDEMHNLCVVNNGSRMLSVYISTKKNYTALMFADEESKEKIITFGIAKNTNLSMSADGDYICIYWTENGIMMQAVSRNGGESFGKPQAIGRNIDFDKVRTAGEKPGIKHGDLTVMREHRGKSANQQFDRYERMNKMNNRPGYEATGKAAFADMDSAQFVHKLASIENEIAKIGAGLDKVCTFLDRLLKFKEDTHKDHFPVKSEQATVISDVPSSDIGEKNEENIRLFESMDIDEVLTNQSDGITVINEEDMDE